MNRRWQIVSAVTALAAIGFVGSVLTTPPATGYESSIHDAYPPQTWVGFGLALVGGLTLVFRSAITDRPGWRYGVVTLASVYAVFFALPLFRGYYVYGTPMSDAFYHFGIVRDVLETGTVPETVYPATHLLYATLTTVTGVPMRILQPVVAFCFFLLFVGSCFLLGRCLFGPRGGLATLGAAMPLVFVSHHLTTLPWLFALPFLPLSLSLAHRWADRRRSSRAGPFVAALVCGIALVFYHPVTALVTVLALVVYAGVVAAPSLRRRLPLLRSETEAESGRAYATPYRYPAVLAIAGILWYLSISQVTHFLDRVVTNDIDGGAASYASTAQQTSYSTWELVWEFLVLEWGTVLVYAGLGAGIAAVILGRALRGRDSRLERLCVAQYAAGIGVAVFFVGSRVLSRNVVRINSYTVIGAILLLGLAITGLVSYRDAAADRWKQRGATVALCGLCVSVLVVALLAGAVAYEDDRHVTHATMAGAEWHHENHDSGIDTRAFRMSEQLQRYFEGTTGADPDDRQFHRSLEGYQLPTRLGYDDHGSVGDVYENETYLVTKTADIEWARNRPPDRRAEIDHYTDDDRDRLRADPAAHRIYSNGDVSVWVVEPDG
ncbi:hypothetical protein [Natrinema ejinorense]|uniref:Glycosyltransferase RgtA/B/C/D-like domain-containing protein n=1 Tax=Natrinema ejinorense TaxID=373386 RepID=A0A2A5QZ95_9EURY|nr:hypothetical protein [Natrinema ejinorense]PCR92170.1 hypothetical protein CP557_17535 [Natrinema ejinorense]